MCFRCCNFFCLFCAEISSCVIGIRWQNLPEQTYRLMQLGPSYKLTAAELGGFFHGVFIGHFKQIGKPNVKRRELHHGRYTRLISCRGSLIPAIAQLRGEMIFGLLSEIDINLCASWTSQPEGILANYVPVRDQWGEFLSCEGQNKTFWMSVTWAIESAALLCRIRPCRWRQIYAHCRQCVLRWLALQQGRQLTDKLLPANPVLIRGIAWASHGQPIVLPRGHRRKR